MACSYYQLNSQARQGNGDKGNSDLGNNSRIQVSKGSKQTSWKKCILYSEYLEEKAGIIKYLKLFDLYDDNRGNISQRGVLTLNKFISGFITGALLFGGVSAFAASSGLIGQKVQGLFTIEKAGVKVADAVVIKGSA
ncbi:hypothetical protein [Paenibacillus sp. FSL R7-0337]|uniref:hypothetical protein n=1 Tax=Paenibacillus sp. FSL R7-0337 TaxID=1926588 RepID=UPI0009700C2E|nr:hypothetical protein [Paenibacillus sp. FSL R7-0337]OMF89486.1 hypothetical protein BK147_25145 [Paenibacillus sp. FSL R7-0337]